MLSLCFSFECLVLPEIRDRNSQGVNGNKLVWNFALKNKHKICGVKVAFALAVVRGRVINQVEIDPSFERRSLHVFQGDFLHFYVDFWGRRVHEEFLYDVVLAVGVEDAVGQLSVKKIESFREIILNCVAVAAIVERTELTQKVLRLGVLRFVLKIVVVNGFRSAEIVNADHQRTEVLKGS